MTTCDRCGRPAWKPHGGMGGHIAPDYETWCLQRGGQWCRVAEAGAKAERARIVVWLRESDEAVERSCGGVFALARAIERGAHTEET